MIYLISGEDSKLVNRVTAVLSHNTLREDVRVVNVLVFQINHIIVCPEFANTKEAMFWRNALTNWRHLNITVFVPTTRHHTRVSRFIRQRHTHLVKINASDAHYIYGEVTDKIIGKQSNLLVAKQWEKAKLPNLTAIKPK